MGFYVKLLDSFNCLNSDIQNIIGLVRWLYNAVCVAIPVIIIILIAFDLTKVAVSGKLDDKVKKESTNRAITRIVCAVVIFLVPTVVNLIFRILPISIDNEYINCWSGEKTIK